MNDEQRPDKGVQPRAKTDRLEAERDDEQSEGMTAERRGSPAAPSDRPEGTPPHPQDVNEIGERR